MKTRLKTNVHCVKNVSIKKQFNKTRENSIQERRNLQLSKLFFVLIVTFCEGNGLAEVDENDSNDTLESDDDAHKVIVCTHGYFF